MNLQSDTRAQAVQIGAVLLFAALIIAMTGYQATVVPDQNAEVELAHSEQVQSGMIELRNAIVSPDGRTQRDVTIPLGTRYPERTLFINPAPPSGQLETIRGQLNVSNVSVSGPGEAGDYWGSGRTFSTGLIEYRPNYNELDDAPTTVIEGSLVYNRFENAERTVAEPTFIDGTRISLVALQGSVSASTSGSERISVHTGRQSTRTVPVRGTAGENVTISLPTLRSESAWDEYLGDADHVSDWSVTRTPGSSYGTLEIVFDRFDESGQPIEYDLSVAEVGLDESVGSPEAKYVTPVETGEWTVYSGSSTAVSFEVRGRYDDPIAGRRVNLSVVEGRGELVSDSGRGRTVTATTDADGRVEVAYVAGSDETGDVTIGASSSTALPANEPSNFSTATNASQRLRVVAGESSSGPYTIEWDDEKMTDRDGDGEDELVIDAAESPPFTANVTAGVDSGPIEFAVQNRNVLVRDESATSARIVDGTAQFGFELNSSPRSGEWYIYASSRGSGDRVPVYVNTTGLADGPTITNFSVTNPVGRSVTVSFDSDESLADIDVTLDGPERATLDASDFTESDGTYTASYEVSTDGAYSVRLRNAADAGGNDGADAQNETVVVGEPLVFAVNAGGSSYTAGDGVTYVADDGGSPYTTGGSTYSSTSAIANTSDDALYQSERYASGEEFSYDAALDNGTYEVTLKFAEIYFGSGNGGGGGDGSRVFDVGAESEVVVNDLDVHSRVGPDTALVLTRTVAVDDGSLNLTFSDEVQNAKVSAVVVRRIPETRIAISPSDPTTADAVTVRAKTASGTDGRSYEWAFGDGATATGETATHSYANDGTYTVTLTVTDSGGATNTVARQVQVDNVAPSGNITYSPSTPSTTDDVAFDASGSTDADGSIATYEWAFGDGATATGETPTHSYADDGSYDVTLTVTDDDGATDTTTRTITVVNVAPSASYTTELIDNDTDGEVDYIVYDATASSDPDGQIENYQWEIDSDFRFSGTYDRTNPRFVIDVNADNRRVATGEVSLTVIDDDGAQTSTGLQETEVPASSLSTPGMETFAVLIGAALRRRDYL
ncbi:PKD domain-containing protein [Natronoarchaeum rubrum]|uniref:PKD domain-containing protein n=1 Tax=Natronoarchaeum rubrum TaxID=755311 RepID=UPI0021122060|nr:PKD domain-containing protein [Natronoarchaeum rubrum]